MDDLIDLSEMLENIKIIERLENPGQAKEGS
jgi:hypothetical protein